ncbi:MAG: diphthine synthase [Euryarchaeota archaeon]|nr:diphthine synthase [Euryarchaeota archaeon]|tara:strand:+ start:5623 stop:6513 length:891 start_codon:yes stop_codon:yes gene_type:complete
MAEGFTTSERLPETGLLLVGMGPGSVAAMTQEALEAATSAAHRRYEAYTALWPEHELKSLESIIGPIKKVMRPEVEQPEELFALASTSLVALLVVGDPLQATTHVDLQLQAIERGIECRVFHGISVTTLVTGAIGLSNYRFGRQTTLTYPYGGWVATSPMETIAMNQFTGLHTLALLDLDPTGQGTGSQQPMAPEDAVCSIEMMCNKISDDFDSREFENENPVDMLMKSALAAMVNTDINAMRVVLCSDMGTSEQNIITTTVGALSAQRGGRLNCLVFPATTGEVEEKAVLRWTEE